MASTTWGWATGSWYMQSEVVNQGEWHAKFAVELSNQGLATSCFASICEHGEYSDRLDNRLSVHLPSIRWRVSGTHKLGLGSWFLACAAGGFSRHGNCLSSRRIYRLECLRVSGTEEQTKHYLQKYCRCIKDSAFKVGHNKWDSERGG